MLRILVIGIGPGDPELVTVKAIRALNSADLVLIPLKGEEKSDLAELRHEICRRYLENAATRIVTFDLPRRRADDGYIAGVNDWHDAIAADYARLLASEPSAQTVALLVWGDPSLYDSTLRILDRLKTTHGLDFKTEVIPGITSVQALTARHAIPLNGLGGAVLYTTGRRLREGIPDGIDTVVVMLDGETSFSLVPPDEFEIVWGAYLGMDYEILKAGPLADLDEPIRQARQSARDANGWIMDVYILIRRGSHPMGETA